MCRDPTDLVARREFVRGPMIRDWCQRWGSRPEDAEDIAQELILRPLGTMRMLRCDHNRSFRAWLKSVTQNAWAVFGWARRREWVGDSDRGSPIASAIGSRWPRGGSKSASIRP
jgi:DNA-directed RNA polymerase specialized sigma24 family protein